MRQTYQSRPLGQPVLHDKGVTRGRADVLPYYVGTQLVIPAFDVESEWLGASHVVVQYNYIADRAFVIPIYPIDDNSVDVFNNCCVMLAWRVGNRKRRYKLNWDVNERVPACLYNGEVIPVNFTIEIWNTPVHNAHLDADFAIATTLWRDRVLSEVDSSIADVEEPVWAGAYIDLESQSGLVLPLVYSADVQHLSN